MSKRKKKKNEEKKKKKKNPKSKSCLYVDMFITFV